MRDRRRAERANDVHDRVRGAQVAKLLWRDGLARFLRVRQADIAVHHLGLGDLLRFVERRELQDARVRDLGDADVRFRFGPGKGAGRRVRSCQKVEQGGLADVRKTGDGRNNIHARRVSWTSGGSRSRSARTYAPLLTVRTVASTPTARRAVADRAAAAPGRMTPIAGTGNSSRTVSSATDVAVLQAITTSLQSALANQRIASRVNPTTSAGSSGPYGMRASSPR